MRKSITFAYVLFLLFSLTIQSCKKDNGISYDVTYRIIPVHDCITKITYTGSSGSQIVDTDYTKFVDGEKTISVSKKPFDAKIVVETNNQTNITLQYDLYIKVGDVNEIGVSCVATPMSVSTGEAEYLVPNQK